MSQFTFQDFNDNAQRANNQAQNQEATKIGFFKLAKDGDVALVRFNISSVDDLMFASVHKPIFGAKYTGLSNPYAGVNCLNTIGSYSDACPFCKAAAAGHSVVDKASKKVFVPMMVSYKDSTNGTWSAATPVVWERPAGYARDLATKLQNYGDLRNCLLLMTRVGSGQDTRYNLDYAVPAVFKPEMVPADFSAFDNFKVNKHSFWEKSAQEMADFLSTGSFPEVVRANAAPAPSVAQVAQTYQQAPAQPAYTPAPQPVAPAPQVEANPWTAPAPQAAPKTEAPKSFGNFSF